MKFVDFNLFLLIPIGIPLTRGQINPGTQSWVWLGLQNRWNHVIYCTEWTMRVPEASVGASTGRRLDVAWLGLQREADFRKKVLPAATTALFWSMDLPWTPKGPPRDPKRIQGIPLTRGQINPGSQSRTRQVNFIDFSWFQ